LLDEVGRGTSTYDGVSIAWGVTEYLVNKIGCRTLFATHYHELNTLETTHPRIQNFRVCVSETEGEIEFLHTVEPGSAQKSYGIQVAKMAGIPRRSSSRPKACWFRCRKRSWPAWRGKAVGQRWARKAWGRLSSRCSASHTFPWLPPRPPLPPSPPP